MLLFFYTVVKYFQVRKYFLEIILKKSLVVGLLFSISACATQTITEVHITPQFIKESGKLKVFELLSVYQFNNSNQYPWLYELSGIAWDYDDQILYTITDGGHIVILEPSFQDDILVALKILDHYQLQDPNGKPLKDVFSDSEGLALRNHKNGISDDTELIISFERKPRIDLYQINGQFIKRILNFEENFKRFEFLSKNKQLESITELTNNNYLFGSERPLKQSVNDEIRLFDLSNTKGTFKLKDEEYGSLVGLTTVADDTFIALERVFVNVFTPLRFHIHKLTKTASEIKQVTLYSSTQENKYLSDNFEGITHHKDNYFFMISDDNQNTLLRTVLLYFRLNN